MSIQTRRRPVDVTKDPDAILDYGFKWHKWLQTGETVTGSTWVADTGLTVSTSTPPTISGGNITTVWLEGGTAGSNYLVKNHVTTSLGREDDRSMRVHVLER